jgi:hypothetical protein
MQWDELDFLTVLEVEAKKDGYSYLFVVDKDDLILEVCVMAYEDEISITLYKQDISRPLLRLTLVDCLGARRVNDERGEYLEIAGAQSRGGRWDAQQAVPFGVRVSIKPSIQIELI